MRDPIIDAAQDPSCLLCLTPDRGGSWWSRLRPAMPRIFSTSAYWPGFVSAFNSNGIKNYRFSIGFSLSEMPSRDRVLFGNQMALGEGRFMLVLSSKGKIQVQDESSWSGTVEHPISGTGKHTVVIEIAESSGRIMIDGVEYAVSVARTAPILTIAFSNFPGTISSILLEADSGTLWQAAHSDLYAIYEPRNFADNPMAWTDAKTALDVTDQSHDFTFEIEFKCVKTNAVYIFASDGSNDFIRVFMSSGEIIVSTALLSTASGGSTQFSAGSDSTNRHALTVKMIGNTITALIDGEIVYTRENLVRNAIEISAPRSNAGYVYKISITDDTTGEIVWQAAHSNLYNMLPPPPWPSPVPENFAENAKAFYDCQAVVREALDPTHDYSFLIDFKLDEAKTSGNVFYAIPSDAPFALILQSNNQIDFFTNLLKPNGDSNSFASIYAYYQSDVKLQGRHQIECKIEANMLSSYLDGVLVAQKTSNLERTGTVAVGLPNCNSGYVYRIQITDLTDNQVVWSYPSEAERVRLITKTNVRTDRGAFEAADETQPAGVATQLDLRGNSTSKTFWARGYFPKHENNGLLYVHPMIEQGDTIYGTDSWVFRVTVWEDYRAPSGVTALRCDFCDADNAARLCHIRITDDFFNTTHDIAYVIDFQANGAFCSVYIDGSIATQANFTASAFGTGAASAMSANVGIRRDPVTNYLSGNSVECALVFDRALSTAEIAALTPKKQPLSWAGIRDVVRRGRAQRYFAVGDVLTVATPRWTIEYEVTGFDQAEPADAALTHSMTLLPVRLVANLQFDAPEPGNPDANRAQFGCNRWDWSAIRQWMNSAAAPGEWWTAQHEYDAAPAYAATLAGFMADLPADFLSAVAPARLVTALPNADGGGSVETVDRFWLPSRTEIFGDANNGVSEGVLMAKYIDATDAERIKYNSAGTASDSARSWWLRSPSDDSARLSATSVSGTHGTAFTTNTYGVAAACIIA